MVAHHPGAPVFSNTLRCNAAGLVQARSEGGLLNANRDLDELDKLARLFGVIAVRAGEVIMSARANMSRTDYKADGSPVTSADLAADKMIRACLQRNLPHLPVITEEHSAASLSSSAERFILVDPLDGTKEFIQGRSEFTVNIALIERRGPVAGAVYAPALHELFIGGTNAYQLATTNGACGCSFGQMHSIAARSAPPEKWRAVVSRSHLDSATKQWIDRHPIADLEPSGSSLKFCVIAKGEAHVYPRLAPTMEWDTAAGHAVLLAAGGTVTDIDGRPMHYGKLDYRNGDFIAWGNAPGYLQ
jgi:3'(2'), 5'-bisphosphate nucleotidase